MAWPSDADYRDAIQTPKSVFSDPELAQGVAQADKTDLPRPRSGANATVYKIQCGARSWAVRCFRYELQDQQQRYTAIAAYLQQTALNYTVGFSFLPNGIRIRGRWFPVLKMEWIDGETLQTFIQNNLRNPQVLLDLARKWIVMMQALQAASIAHGDLQHGNVLVRNGELKLVDYDGMYVPTLQNLASLEVGHKHYQHPLRTSADFGAYLDNFSSWTIYISLVLLSVDPTLWTRFNGGGDCLLFRKEDFDKPAGSLVFRTLENHRDARIQSAALLFKSLLTISSVKQVPKLNGDFMNAPEAPKATTGPSANNWLSDYVGRPPQKVDQIASTAHDRVESVVDPSWIADFLTPADNSMQAMFVRDFSKERLIILGSVTSTLLLAMGVGVWSIQVLIVVVISSGLNIGLWLNGFFHEPGLETLRNFRQKLNLQAAKIQEANGRIKDNEDEKRRIEATFREDQQKVKKELSAVQLREQHALEMVQSKYRTQLGLISSQKKAVNEMEAAALQKLAGEIDPMLRPLENELNQVNVTESDEIATSLWHRQQEFVATVLRRHLVGNEPIAGVGPSFRNKLQRAGYHSAADINSGITAIHGIGPTRAAAIMNWRKGIEAMAHARMPQSLETGELERIKGKYSQRRRFLQAEIETLKTRRKNQERPIADKANNERDRLNRDEGLLQRQLTSDTEKVRIEHSHFYDAVQKWQTSLEKERTDKLKAVEQNLQFEQKTLFTLQYQEGRIRIAAAPFTTRLTFPKYVKRIFGV